MRLNERSDTFRAPLKSRARLVAVSLQAASKRRPFWAATLALSAALGLFALFVAPSLFKSETLRRDIAEQVRVTTGLSLTADGALRFALLPRPHVVLAGLHIADPSGTLTIDATSLTGEVRLLPLLVGRIEVSSATLEHPRLAINLDGKLMPADSMIGRALRATGGAGTGGAGTGLGVETGSRRLGIVTLVDGTAILKSKAMFGSVTFNAVNVTIDWRNLDAPATLTGSVDFRDVPTDIAAWVAQPSSLLRGDHSPIAMRIQSLPLDLSANGDFASEPGLRFHGRISANAPSLAGLMAIAGYDAALPAPFANLVVTSEATFSAGALDLPTARIRVDGNDFEGALAYQGGKERPALAGTLATDQLSLMPFMQAARPLLDDAHHWVGQKLELDLRDRLDLDLRISATRLRLPPFLIEDAALAVMTRANRTEITLVDGKGYGGAIKARASIGVSEAGLSLRGGGSLTDVDASALSWDLFGRQLATGTLAASLNLESNGESPAALMANLRGWVKASARDGELSDVDFGRGLGELAATRKPEAVVAALREGRTAFDTLDLGARLAGGVASIENSTLKGKDAVVNLGGIADIGNRTLDLTSVGTTPIGESAAPSLRFAIKGTFNQPVVTPDFNMPPSVGSSP